MRFDVGRDDVLRTLSTALGERLGTGVAPVRTMTVVPGDFWRTEEGVWVCGENVVAWYSTPFRLEDGYAPIEGFRALDHYVRPVPGTAALWKQIGRQLIGLDTAPRKQSAANSVPEREERERERASRIKRILFGASIAFLCALALWHHSKPRQSKRQGNDTNST